MSASAICQSSVSLRSIIWSLLPTFSRMKPVNAAGIGPYGRISTEMSPGLVPQRIREKRQKNKTHNWAAVTLRYTHTDTVVVASPDSRWWIEASPRIFRCCTTKSMIRKWRSVTRNAAVGAGCGIGTPCPGVGCDYTGSQMSSRVKTCNMRDTLSSLARSLLVIIGYCSSHLWLPRRQ